MPSRSASTRRELLKSLGVPLAPFGEATHRRRSTRCRDDDQQKLMHLGMVIPMEYDAGNGEQTDYTPVWTLKSTYTWEADFPAGKTVEVVHAYTPSVGGTVATTFLAPPDDATDEDRPSDYKKKYCTDDDFIKTVKKTLKDPNDLYSAPYYRELDLLHLVDRRQLERADRQVPPHHRQGRRRRTSSRSAGTAR